MKRRYMVTLSVIFILFASAATGWSAGSKNPRITILNDSYDFGFVPIDYRLVHAYKIRNDGDGELKIGKLIPNCDCTSALAKDTLVLPDSTTEVVVYFDTKNYYGPNTRHVTVHSNDPDNPEVVLNYASSIGMLPKSYRVDPQSLFFLPGHKAKNINLINISDKKIGFRLEVEPGAFFSLSEEEGNIGSRDSTQIEIVPIKDIPRGTHYGNFTVVYNDKAESRITVPVKIVRY